MVWCGVCVCVMKKANYCEHEREMISPIIDVYFCAVIYYLE